MALISGGGGGGAPSGAAGGDLAGAYPNPTFDLTKAHSWTGEVTVNTAATTTQALELQGSRTSGEDVFRIDYPHTVMTVDSDGIATFSSNDSAFLFLVGLSHSGSLLSVYNDDHSGTSVNIGTDLGVQVNSATDTVLHAVVDANGKLQLETQPINPLTRQLVSGAAMFFGNDPIPSDHRTFTPVTFNPGAATAATCLVQVSPDDVTYTTLWTETVPAGVALDGTIHCIQVYLPRTWYLKLTVNAQATLGLTTYY